jgi:hypothetical protein
MDKIKYSPIILMSIENLRSTVNIGKFKDCVPPNPHMTFPKKRRKTGKISLRILKESGGMSMNLKEERRMSMMEVIRN